ncbi:MAG: sigma-70 family RNA polymerase sigma factor [Polyangiaceae bacterium]
MGLVCVAPGERWAENDEETPEAKLSREELRRDVRSAIEELPERQRALVRRHYFGGESFEAIAGDLGVSKSWASRLHAQAMAQLAEALRRDP